jgi:hypothetical protein
MQARRMGASRIQSSGMLAAVSTALPNPMSQPPLNPRDLELISRGTIADFVEVGHYYRPPGPPREQQPWLASVWRKAGKQAVA